MPNLMKLIADNLGVEFDTDFAVKGRSEVYRINENGLHYRSVFENINEDSILAALVTGKVEIGLGAPKPFEKYGYYINEIKHFQDKGTRKTIAVERGIRKTLEALIEARSNGLICAKVCEEKFPVIVKERDDGAVVVEDISVLGLIIAELKLLGFKVAPLAGAGDEMYIFVE